MEKPSLAIEFCGIRMKTPVVLLSGCVGFGEEYTRITGYSNQEVGAICLKGTTLEARLGNTPHRVIETPGGMINSIGLQNPGARHVIEDIIPRLDLSETRYIANISGSSIDEYGEITKLFDDSPVDAIEINISCPNVKDGGAVFGNDPEVSARVVEACRKATTKPLITKLSPNQTDIADSAQHCIDAGTDAFAVINTLMGMSIDIEKRRPVIGNNQGGLSGPAIKPVALRMVHLVHQVCKDHNIPIIGQGGISSAEDALEFIIAGATAIGVGTALFNDPLICKEINQGIVSYMEKHQINSLSELTGTLSLNQPAPATPACNC
ncbi:MAG: dihydroorotate dehydrogenase [Gammaproteobacteria bacterium]|uniref:Dihydroorotate dehydrogenase n=1 Tax=Candidatus Thiopontia autotrophica TaxID=2841688 RepID=A0A8J6PB04_9GAMM|nr:dihydroorotate dehydrogenase [Candidatus Thiopontia autotrophica]MBL6968823.1 dihydroorotate dehydrogenase [Gammaproteobacteria bacterium]